ncbi:hypothetical protein L9F63_009786, partial [Diploptera punctata]
VSPNFEIITQIIMRYCSRGLIPCFCFRGSSQICRCHCTQFLLRVYNSVFRSHRAAEISDIVLHCC